MGKKLQKRPQSEFELFFEVEIAILGAFDLVGPHPQSDKLVRQFSRPTLGHYIICAEGDLRQVQIEIFFLNGCVQASPDTSRFVKNP